MTPRPSSAGAPAHTSTRLWSTRCSPSSASPTRRCETRPDPAPLRVKRDALGEGDQDRGLELRRVRAGVRPPAGQEVERHLAAGDLVIVPVGDLELAAGGGLEPVHDLEDAR